MKAALILSGGGFQGLGLLEALQCLPDVRPIVADVHHDNVTRYQCADYFAMPPIANEEAFVSELRRLLESLPICAVFPATARELPLLARIREDIGRLGAQAAVSSPELVGILLDKVATAGFLHDNGLPAQALVDPGIHDFSSPLFGKPRHGWGGTGTATVYSLEEARLHEAVRGMQSMAWFPLVEKFREYSFDFALSPGGHLSPLVARRRIRTSGGYAVISESVDIPELDAIARKAAMAIAGAGGRGIFNVQVLHAETGEAFVSDVNPRFGTSAVHGLAEGVNLAGFFMDDQPALPGAGRIPVRTVRRLQTIALPTLPERPTAIVFDLDDTLVDHKLWMAAKIRGAAAAVRDWVDEDDFLLAALQFVDEGERAHLVDRLAAHFGWASTQHSALLEAYRSAAVETPLYADVAPVLSSLHEAGFKLAILTDNPPATQRAKIEGAEALGVVSSVVYSREAGGEKPHAAAFAAAASALSIRPEQAYMVGDNYFRDALGAIRHGYGRAFLVRRAGAFAEHHAGIRRIVPANHRQDRIHAIDSLIALREILLPA